MLDLRIPISSTAAGPESDGVTVGGVNQSALTAVIADVRLAGAVYAIRRDAVTGGGFTFTDVSTAAGDDTTNDFLPFGATAAMSAGDSLFIACDNPIKALYFNVSTVGNWAGGALEVWESTDGVTAGRQLTAVVDGTNGFRNAGVNRVSWTAPAEPGVAFTPVPGDITSRRWIVIKAPSVTSVTAAPQLARVWVEHADTAITYTDVTSFANGDLATSPVFADAFFPVAGAASYWAFSNPAFGIEHYMFRSSAAVRTQVAEYLAADGTWKSLPGFTDGSAFFTNGPTVAAVSPDRFNARWSVPSDWPAVAQSFAGIANPVTGHWIRFRTTAVATFGPARLALARFRARMFGSGNAFGIRHADAKSYTRVTARCAAPAATAAVVQASNAFTGASSSLTIPAGSRHVSADISLAVAAGDELMVSHLSGGSMSDLSLHLA